MEAIRPTAGSTADGALPNAAMPDLCVCVCVNVRKRREIVRKEGDCERRRRTTTSTLVVVVVSRTFCVWVGIEFRAGMTCGYHNGHPHCYSPLPHTHTVVFLHSPAGRLNTPAPTIFLTRLKTSSGIVAVPPVVAGASTSSEASLSSSGLSLLLLAVSHNCVVVVDCVPSNGVVRNEWSPDVVVVVVIGVV